MEDMVRKENAQVEPNKLTLYGIASSFQDLMEKASTGELTQEEYDSIGLEIATQLQKKSTSIIGFYKNNELTINAVEEEIKRLTDYVKSLKKKNEKFVEYVKENMDRLNLVKIETPNGVLSIANCPTSVEIVNEEEVPNEYKQEVKTIKIDKTKIKNNFKETGEIVPGVNMITNKTSLRIK